MYVRKPVLETSVKSIVHHFLSPAYDDIGYKLQPAGPGYESVWGTTAVVPYVKSLTPIGTVAAGYEAIAAHDTDLAARLLEYLTAPKQRARGIRVVGSERPGADRMPTISILVLEGKNGEKAWGSKELIGEFDKKGKVPVVGPFEDYANHDRLGSDMDISTPFRLSIPSSRPIHQTA
jgi:selenocysteine lyase/cysteine desulfurase